MGERSAISFLEWSAVASMRGRVGRVMIMPPSLIMEGDIWRAAEVKTF